MRILLDTHALVWWLTADERLGTYVRSLIIDRRNDTLVSIVSLWEITLKVRIGKMNADIDRIARLSEQAGFEALGISKEHLVKLLTLPIHHRDPFDHLLIAQAISEGATFISDDRQIREYPVRTILCSSREVF